MVDAAHGIFILRFARSFAAKEFSDRTVCILPFLKGNFTQFRILNS